MDASSWIALAALAVATLGLAVAYGGLKVSRLGHRLAADMAHRELVVEPGRLYKQTGIEYFDLIVHNQGSRSETVTGILVVDGSREHRAEAGNVVVPGHDHRPVTFAVNMLKNDWGDTPKLSAAAYIQIATLAGTTARLQHPDPWLFVDSLTAGSIEVMRTQ